ncbi:MAG: hypothetical protein Q8L13_13285 [Bradyrhizobium sp.]|uniref:hypothetical protein n=1 Tax=Bradyrhizobium sp. TaxID=376 RepID=UPI00273035F8|nr:hypothetical protein [Bradyrhizobium sp.]MDP1867300.1 hypothetical protein [Bradyrhizobium sp.]
MPRSHTPPQRSEGIWPKATGLSATQFAILLAIAIALIFALDRALDASRSRAATRSDMPVSAVADCPQLAETFDSQRAACLRRRWSAARETRPWRDASRDMLLEDCLRSSGGEIAVPFRTNACGNPKSLSRLPRAPN